MPGPAGATNLTGSASTSRMKRVCSPLSPGIARMPIRKSLCIAWFSIVPLTASAQTADEIVNKALAARGGVEKIKAVKSERVTGRISFTGGMEGTFVLELKRPRKMHLEIDLGGQSAVRVYDGKSAGWMINPFAENKDVQPMSEEDLKGISEESDFDGPLVDYQAKGSQIELIGKEQFDNKPVYRLKLTNKNGNVRFYVFDASTFVLMKWEGIRRIEDKEFSWESLFSDYRDVQGLKYAFQIDQGSPGTEIKQNLVTEKIEIDPQIDDSRFAKPAPPEAPPPAAPSTSQAPPAETAPPSAT
jgi:outer membrane lipoprotein-sorting protein